jgi:hypothetical protein
MSSVATLFSARPQDRRILRDAMHDAFNLTRHLDGAGLSGYGLIEHRDGDGEILGLQPFANKITDQGDLYYATKAIVGIGSSPPSAPTALTGMKLGTGTTAPAKAGVGAASLAASADYITGSNQVFDTSFPSTTNLGTTLGVQAVYKVTYAAGTATNSAIASAVIVNDAATNATTTVANTVSRVTFTAVNKGASDTLAITWNHLFLGA